MNKKIKTKAMTITMLLLLVSLGSFAAVLGQPNIETKATQILEVVEKTSEKLGDLIILIETNETIQEKIDEANLTEAFEGNVTVYLEGITKLNDASECFSIADYGSTIENATEALSIFKTVYRSINLILHDSDVSFARFVDSDELQQAIERSQERVNELKDLISVNEPIYQKLLDAEGNLTRALELLPDNIEGAKASLRKANILISEICNYLKEIAQELNPQRIRDYCEGAYQYRERFRERFGQAKTENFDVDGFLQGFGFQNEDDFMVRFQEMIQKAETSEDIEEVLNNLEEVGRLIREMDQNLTQEMGHHRAAYGQAESGSSFGKEASGSFYKSNGGSYGGGDGSGQLGFGGSQ